MNMNNMQNEREWQEKGQREKQLRFLESELNVG